MYQFRPFANAIVPAAQPEDPSLVVGRALTLRGLKQQNELGEMQVTAGRQAEADDAELRTAFKSAGGDMARLKDMLSRSQKGVGIVAGMEKSRLDARKVEGDIAHTDAQTAEAKLKLDKGKIDELAQKAGSLLDLSEEERATAWPVARQDWIGRKLITQEDLPVQYPGEATFRQLHGNAVDAQKRVENHFKQADELRKNADEGRKAELHGPAVQTAEAKAEVDRVAAEQITQFGMSQKDYEAGKLAVEKHAESKRKNKADEGETQRHHLSTEAEAASNEAVPLTEESLNKMGDYFATTGQMPALGLGKEAGRQRAAIINRATERFPNVVFASSSAVNKANKASLQDVTKMLVNLSSFESTTGKSLGLFLDAMEKVPDTGVPWLNAPIRLLDEKLVGSTNIAVANAARQVALTEIAKVITDPKMAGLVSDHAREEVKSLSPASATVGQVRAVAKLLKQEMDNRRTGLVFERDALVRSFEGPSGVAGGGAHAGSPGAAPPAAALITVVDPSGVPHKFRTQADADIFKNSISAAQAKQGKK